MTTNDARAGSGSVASDTPLESVSTWTVLTLPTALLALHTDNPQLQVMLLGTLLSLWGAVRWAND